MSGILHHQAVGFLAGDDAAVQIQPFLTAESEVIHDFFGVLVHKTVHQKIAGVEIHNNAPEVEQDVFIHKSRFLPVNGFAVSIIHRKPPVNNRFFSAYNETSRGGARNDSA